jgi:hypothetical protein
MRIQNLPQFNAPLKKLPSAAPQNQPQQPQESFQPGPPQPEKSTSWFHRTTGALAGSATLATIGTLAIGSLGNGRGGDGLIFPVIGFVAGAGAGLIAGALAAGHAHSDTQHTSFYHRATAVASGALVGGLAGMVLLAPAGNGMGGDGLIYPLLGLAGGSAAGAIGLGLAAGHFPDR